MKFTRSLLVDLIMSKIIAAVLFSIIIAFLIFFVSPPMKQLELSGNYQLDTSAIIVSAISLAFLASVVWIPISFLKISYKKPSYSFLLTSACTAILLFIIFNAIDGRDAPFGHFELLNAYFDKATSFLWDGNDLAFVPIYLPIISLLSGFINYATNKPYMNGQNESNTNL